MSRASRLWLAVLVVLLFGVVGMVYFRGVAANEKPPSILLKWNPPPPTPGSTVAGYNIYRSLPNGTYKEIAVGVTTPSYVDHDVSKGTTYHYQVRAVDTAGHESPPSNLVTTAIP